MSQTPQVWFVVGSSTGFGLSMAKCALQKGDRVIASVRKAEALASLQVQYPDQLLVVVFDTRNYDDVKAAFELGKTKFGRIDVIFNNAGIAIGGELEGIPEDAARSIFDVNFWGAVNISREAVRTFREQTPRGGRLLQVSSNWAMECPPGFGVYSASKAGDEPYGSLPALEAISESLAREIEPEWQIKITLIEPGAFKTEISSNSQFIRGHPAYTSPTTPFAQYLPSIMDPTVFADVEDASVLFHELAHLPEPPLRFPIHPRAVETARGKAESIKKDADAYASWSDRLHFKL